MKKKRLSKKEKNTPGPNFRGYTRNWDNNKKRFKKPYTPYELNKEAINMIENKKIGGPPSKGSGKKVHSAAPDKFRELNFDPIDGLLEQLAEIEKNIKTELESDNPRSSYLNNMQVSKLRILETLLPYKYGKAPTVTTETSDPRQPIRIILTDDDKDSD